MGSSGINVATPTSTRITITDTTAPIVNYYGNHKIQHSAGVTMTHSNYLVKHTCRDSCCGNLDNEDKKKPIITILGKDIMSIEATHDANYVDDGATCSDQVDGVISQDVEVSGDVVNLS